MRNRNIYRDNVDNNDRERKGSDVLQYVSTVSNVTGRVLKKYEMRTICRPAAKTNNSRLRDVKMTSYIEFWVYTKSVVIVVSCTWVRKEDLLKLGLRKISYILIKVILRSQLWQNLGTNVDNLFKGYGDVTQRQ